MKNIRLHGREIVFGSGSLKYIEELKYKRYFIVTGKSAMFKNGTIDKIKKIIEGIKKLNSDLSIPASFMEMGISEKEFINNYEVLLDNSMLGSTRSNPITISKEEMDKVLKSIFYGKILFQ